MLFYGPIVLEINYSMYRCIQTVENKFKRFSTELYLMVKIVPFSRVNILPLMYFPAMRQAGKYIQVVSPRG